jgi:Met-10+ like-protein
MAYDSDKSECTPVIYVAQRNAKLVKELLAKKDYLNKDFRMVPALAENDLIAIPVKLGFYKDESAWGDMVVGTGEQECPYSTAKLGNSRVSVQHDLTRVQQALWNWLKKDATIKEKVLQLNANVCPKKLELFGDDRTLIIPRKAFSLDDDTFRSMVVGHANLNDLWRHLAQVYDSPRVAKRGDIDPNSPIRESGHEILWPVSGRPDTTGPGSPGWITVTEQGIRQSLDMTRVMFSRGNITEKIRFAKVVQEGDVLVDLYAGIGYYTLPALVHGKAAHVYACEWNEHAACALAFNLKANAVYERSTIFVGDCRTSAKDHSLVDICDRVSLGLLPSSEGGWRTAVRALRRSTGGWLHIHGNVPEKEQTTWVLWLCRCLARITVEEVLPDWAVVCTNVERVKSFAPTVYHYVADVLVGPRKAIRDRGIMISMGAACVGMMNAATGEFSPSPDQPSKPSCALDINGVLHQDWMMEDRTEEIC